MSQMKLSNTEILLIEDNPDHAEIISRLLTEQFQGVRIKWLPDGEAALNFLFHEKQEESTGSQLPHLILLDLRLPKVDGLDVLKQIKSSKILKTIPVVILSTSAAENDISSAKNLLANSYLVKPMDLETFGRLVEIIGNYWLLWDRQ